MSAYQSYTGMGKKNLLQSSGKMSMQSLHQQQNQGGLSMKPSKVIGHESKSSMGHIKVHNDDIRLDNPVKVNNKIIMEERHLVD